MHTEVAIHSMNAYVWCWRKACGSLDEIPSVTMGTCKRKFIMNSNMTLTVLNLPQQTDPKVQQDFKGQYSKVKGQSVLRGTPKTLNQCPYQVSTSYTSYGFQDIAQTRYYSSSSLQQVQRLNQGHTMTLHTYYPQPMSSPSISFLHLTVSEIYPRQDFIGQGHYGKGQRSNQGHTMMLHIYTPNQCPYQVSSFYTLQLLRYSPDHVL